MGAAMSTPPCVFEVGKGGEGGEDTAPHPTPFMGGGGGGGGAARAAEVGNTVGAVRTVCPPASSQRGQSTLRLDAGAVETVRGQLGMAGLPNQAWVREGLDPIKVGFTPEEREVIHRLAAQLNIRFPGQLVRRAAMLGIGTLLGLLGEPDKGNGG